MHTEGRIFMGFLVVDLSSNNLTTARARSDRGKQSVSDKKKVLRQGEFSCCEFSCCLPAWIRREDGGVANGELARARALISHTLSTH